MLEEWQVAFQVAATFRRAALRLLSEPGWDQTWLEHPEPTHSIVDRDEADDRLFRTYVCVVSVKPTYLSLVSV